MTSATKHSTRDVPEEIDHNTLGRVPLLSHEDIEDAIGATGFQLLENVDRREFGRCLNNIVEHTIREQLTFRLTSKTVRKLRNSIETYRDISRSLVHGEFYPPPPPLEWMEQVEAWITKAEEGMVERSLGGAPSNLEQQSFMPKALGLMHAGFGVEPDASTSRHAQDGTGAAFRFIMATYSLVSEAIAERGFSKKVHPDLVAKARWLLPADDALVKRLQSALNYRLTTAEWKETGSRKGKAAVSQTVIEAETNHAWRIYSRQYRRILLSH